MRKYKIFLGSFEPKQKQDIKIRFLDILKTPIKCYCGEKYDALKFRKAQHNKTKNFSAVWNPIVSYPAFDEPIRCHKSKFEFNYRFLKEILFQNLFSCDNFHRK